MDNNNSFKSMAQNIAKQLESNLGSKYRSMTNAEKETVNNKQLNKLYRIEKKIVREMIEYPSGYNAYVKFVKYLLSSNLLHGQIYYRERASIYSKNIIPKIKKENIKGLSSFNGNYNLIQYLLDNWSGTVPKPILDMHQEFLAIRNVLIENNMPLAVNYAKIYYNKMPKTHIQFLDMVNMSVNGLINGVDKYKKHKKSAFIQVCIGRIISILLHHYNQSMVYLYPNDKKLLYKANKIKNKYKLTNINDIHYQMNKQLKQDKIDGKKVITESISMSQLHFLLNGADVHSIDYMLYDNDSDHNNLHIYIKDDRVNIEETCINNDILKQLYNVLDKLYGKERKVIKMKGVLNDFD